MRFQRYSNAWSSRTYLSTCGFGDNSYTYDHANRRAGKHVQEKMDGQWQDRYHHRYVYEGSIPVAEIDADTYRVLRTFAWGEAGKIPG